MAQQNSRGFLHWLQDEFQSERLLPGLTSGLLMDITEAIIALSLGSLIFSGELAAYRPYRIASSTASCRGRRNLASYFIATEVTSSRCRRGDGPK